MRTSRDAFGRAAATMVSLLCHTLLTGARAKPSIVQHATGSSMPTPGADSLPNMIFMDGEAVPDMPGYTYNFGIPALQPTPRGNLLAFCQAMLNGPGQKYNILSNDVRSQTQNRMLQDAHQHHDSLHDGRGRWTDITVRRSTDNGASWGPLKVICRNSTLGANGTRDSSLEHSCQQPAPVADQITGKIIFLSSLDNWFQRSIESVDDGISWTPWDQARDLDGSLRKPGWGLVFNGLPGGIQLQSPNPHAGRLVVCSSAYWSGGEMVDGRIVKAGDTSSRYSFTIISDDHGDTWRIGSNPIQPYHTTECSVAQHFDGFGELYLYTRIWDRKPSESRRGIAKSTDGGETWDSAQLRGLGDTAPDCEGSLISVNVSGETCFFVSAPWSNTRTNLTVQYSCGKSAPDVWSPGISVFPKLGQSQSYSSLAYINGSLLDLYMVSNKTSGGIGLSTIKWQNSSGFQ